jgi:choline dehydrogenase-like flavoprotein
MTRSFVDGVDGRRVVDTSVMSRIKRDKTNVPVIMVAGPAADLIRDEGAVQLAASALR